MIWKTCTKNLPLPYLNSDLESIIHKLSLMLQRHVQKNSGNSGWLPLPENFLSATEAKGNFRNFYRHLPTASCADVLNVESVTASRQYFQRELNFFTDGMPTVLLMKLHIITTIKICIVRLFPKLSEL